MHGKLGPELFELFYTSSSKICHVFLCQPNLCKVHLKDLF
ncbi:unnamed protein product [Spirodela intermedia]|uniref:Uncharacterized protein n=1 Tax=Spirodela intermedia TaxID=51605 RepID=A0A7I8LKN3_SPIIN|nr:unnamed protein product [Spirodela intermedia]